MVPKASLKRAARMVYHADDGAVRPIQAVWQVQCCHSAGVPPLAGGVAAFCSFCHLSCCTLCALVSAEALKACAEGAGTAVLLHTVGGPFPVSYKTLWVFSAFLLS